VTRRCALAVFDFRMRPNTKCCSSSINSTPKAGDALSLRPIPGITDSVRGYIEWSLPPWCFRGLGTIDVGELPYRIRLAYIYEDP